MSARTGPARPSRRRAGLPFIIGGGLLAVLTFGGVFIYTTSATGTPAGNVPVVVAALDLPIRVPVLPADLTVVQYQSADVPPGSFSSVSEIKGVVAAITIAKGQPVTSNMLLTSADLVVGPQSAYLPIPAGFVALTIPTSEQQGVAGYPQVGDYLSMVAVIAGKTSTNIRTIYTNVPVIRVGAAPAAAAGSTSNQPQTGGVSTSLTIVVTQCQAEYIAWFLANGTLRYTLESYHDYRPQDANADPFCPSVNAATGVTQAAVAARWPGILN